MKEIEEGRTVYARIPYIHDKEYHISTVQSPHDGLFVDAREFIPSKEFYGRGLTFPIELLDAVLNGFEEMWHENGGGDSGEGTEDRAKGTAG